MATMDVTKQHLINLSKIRKEVISKSRTIKNLIVKQDQQNLDETSKKYVSELIKQMKDYHLIEAGNQGMAFTNKTFDMFARFGFSLSPSKPIKPYIGNIHLIELKEIKSFRKGEGKKLIKQLCNISDNTNVPIGLWVEIGNEGVIPYYEQFGFALLNNCKGINGEYFIFRNLKK